MSLRNSLRSRLKFSDLAIAATAGGLVVMVLLAFSPSLENGFVNWDDNANFVNNHSFRGLGSRQIAWAWSNDLLGVYQPLAWMVFSAEYTWAKGLDPRVFHLASLMLHSAVTLAVFGLAIEILERLDPSKRPGIGQIGAVGLATAFFAVHPLRVEVVAWASCQPYLPSTLFSVLAIVAYLRGHPSNGPTRVRWLIMAWFASVAAMLFKAIAVPIPAVLLILDIVLLKRQWTGPSSRSVWLEKVLFSIPALIAMGGAVLAKDQVQSVVTIEGAGLIERFVQGAYGIAFCLAKSVSPTALAYHYPRPDRIDLGSPKFLAATLAVLGLTAEAIHRRKRRPGLLAAWAALLVVLAPTAGFVSLRQTLMADRYTYAGSICLVIPLAILFDRFRRPAIAWVAGLAILAGLVVMTRSQCRTWLDSERMWEHALSVGAGESWAIHNNLGVLRAQQNRLGEAWSHFSTANRSHPEVAEPITGLGGVLFRRGRFEEAAEHFRAAIRIDSKSPKIWNDLGMSLASDGQGDQALDAYSRAIALDPTFAQAQCNLGLALARLGRLDEAANRLRQALLLDPHLDEARRGLDTLQQQSSTQVTNYRRDGRI